jgi:5-oxoprolinase (ATP-hydrolysing) subunit A
VRGDSARAFATASLVRQRLEQAGVTLKSFKPVAA